jgi:hypothetical protein
LRASVDPGYTSHGSSRCRGFFCRVSVNFGISEDEKTADFCGCDVGFFDFQISLKFPRHHFSAVVFNGVCEMKNADRRGLVILKAAVFAGFGSQG